MKRYDLIVIGAGPAGLSAAIQAAKNGVEVAVFDENKSPGGQLFKQIHKFFGSREHKAKVRGFRIGQELLKEAKEVGVVVHLNAIVMGLYNNKEIMVIENEETVHYKADAIIIATGAKENMIPFEGWTLPGVVGAGAAQTMMNLHGVKPGSKVLMVGSGNVGLVVSYQLLQAGIEVAAIIDAAPRVGGYGVHAAKVSRTGVPFYLSHTIVKAEGEESVTGAIIAQVDDAYQPIVGTEKHLAVDTICMAVGLSPMSKLLRMAACKMSENDGSIPVLDGLYQTSVEGIFASGDVAGIEEASSAMITGRISGIAASQYLGYVDEHAGEEAIGELKISLSKLHMGMFSPENRGRIDIPETDEGYKSSESLLKKGYIDEDEVVSYPGVTDKKRSGVRPVIECVQNIPCDPCQEACKHGCIKVGENITKLPAVDHEQDCIGCGLCVASCPGQAIFLVDDDYDDEYATVTMPYEFLPYPKAGTRGVALSRAGERVCEAQVLYCRTNTAMDHTALLTIKVPKEMSMKARCFTVKEAQDE